MQSTQGSSGQYINTIITDQQHEEIHQLNDLSAEVEPTLPTSSTTSTSGAAQLLIYSKAHQAWTYYDKPPRYHAPAAAQSSVVSSTKPRPARHQAHTKASLGSSTKPRRPRINFTYTTTTVKTPTNQQPVKLSIVQRKTITKTVISRAPRYSESPKRHKEPVGLIRHKNLPEKIS